MHNVEFKAELRDYDLAKTICKAIGATEAIVLDQTDTYYKVPSGRLKKREQTGQEPEYIFYDRANKAEARLSHYVIYDEPTAKQRFACDTLPVLVVVSKQRLVYLTGNIRIHLDKVVGLGTFLEIEAVVSRAHNVRACHDKVIELKAKLLPAIGEMISMSYSDMMMLEQGIDIEDIDPVSNPNDLISDSSHNAGEDV
jgi:adenylate cyclase class 2